MALHNLLFLVRKLISNKLVEIFDWLYCRKKRVFVGFCSRRGLYWIFPANNKLPEKLVAAFDCNRGVQGWVIPLQLFPSKHQIHYNIPAPNNTSILLNHLLTLSEFLLYRFYFMLNNVKRIKTGFVTRWVHLKNIFIKLHWWLKAFFYDISCADCSKSYVGETQRKFLTRKGEPQKAVARRQGEKSALVDHVITTNHDIRWDETTIGHFRVHIRLLFKASLSAKFLWL